MNNYKKWVEKRQIFLVVALKLQLKHTCSFLFYIYSEKNHYGKKND